MRLYSFIFMSVDLSEELVVGVTARALFNLEAENDIFEK